jgi:hypothetical protein
VAHDPRERVTAVDLRGLGAAVQLRAAAECTTVAALARRAITAMLDAPVSQADLFSGVAAAAPRVQPDGLPVKVTVRVSATHAVTLATRAHSADVSQGAYVAGLLDNAPPWRVLLVQFKGAMIVILLGAALLAAWVGSVKDASVILALGDRPVPR